MSDPDCGHHPSVFVRNAESGVVFCELCEVRSERDDAVKMEAEYRAERNKLKKALDLAVSRGCDHCAESIKAARAVAGTRS